jgi:hypothetical protein
MGPDLIGPLEARLIAVERRTVRLDDELRTLRRGVVETQQRIRDSWSDWRLRAPVAVATPPVVACATVTVALKNCNGTAALAAGGTITITSAGGTVYGPCTTNGSGQCSIGLPTSGTYTISADYPNFATTTRSLSFTCSNTTVNVSMKSCDPAAMLAAYPTVTLTIGGNSYTMTGAMSGSTLTYGIAGGSGTFTTPNRLNDPTCAIVTGSAAFDPQFSCSVAGASVGCLTFSYGFWVGSCGTPTKNGLELSGATYTHCNVTATLSSYSLSPLNAVFALNSVTVGCTALNSLIPFSGNAVITP